MQTLLILASVVAIGFAQEVEVPFNETTTGKVVMGVAAVFFCTLYCSALCFACKRKEQGPMTAEINNALLKAKNKRDRQAKVVTVSQKYGEKTWIKMTLDGRKGNQVYR